MANNEFNFDPTKHMSHEEVDMAARNMWRIQNQLNSFPGMKDGPGQRESKAFKHTDTVAEPTHSKLNDSYNSLMSAGNDSSYYVPEWDFYTASSKYIHQMNSYKGKTVSFEFVLDKLTIFAEHYNLESPKNFIENYNYFFDDVCYCNSKDYTEYLRRTYYYIDSISNNNTISTLKYSAIFILGEYFITNCFNLLDKGIDWDISDGYLNERYDSFLDLCKYKKKLDDYNNIANSETVRNRVESYYKNDISGIVGSIIIVVAVLAIMFATGFIDYVKIMWNVLLTVFGF